MHDAFCASALQHFLNADQAVLSMVTNEEEMYAAHTALARLDTPTRRAAAQQCLHVVITHEHCALCLPWALFSHLIEYDPLPVEARYHIEQVSLSRTVLTTRAHYERTDQWVALLRCVRAECPLLTLLRRATKQRGSVIAAESLADLADDAAWSALGEEGAAPCSAPPTDTLPASSPRSAGARRARRCGRGSGRRAADVLRGPAPPAAAHAARAGRPRRAAAHRPPRAQHGR